MEEQVRKLNRDYGLALSEEEILSIARQGEEYERLFRRLYEIDLTGVVPLLTLKRKPRQ